MKIPMRVHGVSMHHVERTVTHEGEEARAMVAELEVELMNETDGHGTMALHFRSQSKIAAAKELFGKGGDTVIMTITKVDLPAIETKADEAEVAA